MPGCSPGIAFRGSPLTLSRGEKSPATWYLELVFELDAAVAAQDRPPEVDTVLGGVSAETGVALGEADLIGQVRAHQTNFPVVAELGDDAGGQVVVAAQGVQARVVLVVYTDVLVGHVLGHRAPGEGLRVTRRHANLEVRQASELFTTDGAADGFSGDVLVEEATLEILVVGLLVLSIDSDLEVPDRLEVQ